MKRDSKREIEMTKIVTKIFTILVEEVDSRKIKT